MVLASPFLLVVSWFSYSFWMVPPVENWFIVPSTYSQKYIQIHHTDTLLFEHTYVHELNAIPLILGPNIISIYYILIHFIYYYPILSTHNSMILHSFSHENKAYDSPWFSSKKTTVTVVAAPLLLKAIACASTSHGATFRWTEGLGAGRNPDVM